MHARKARRVVAGDEEGAAAPLAGVAVDQRMAIGVARQGQGVQPQAAEIGLAARGAEQQVEALAGDEHVHCMNAGRPSVTTTLASLSC